MSANRLTPAGSNLNDLHEACAKRGFSVGLATKQVPVLGQEQSVLDAIEIYDRVVDYPSGKHTEDGLVTRLPLTSDVESCAAELAERMRSHGLID